MAHLGDPQRHIGCYLDLGKLCNYRQLEHALPPIGWTMVAQHHVEPYGAPMNDNVATSQWLRL